MPRQLRDLVLRALSRSAAELEAVLEQELVPKRPILVLTQGDPAGVGPEILLRALSRRRLDFVPWLIAERAALEPRRPFLPAAPWRKLAYVRSVDDARKQEGKIVVFDPIGVDREVRPGAPSGADAAGAMAALDRGLDLVLEGAADAMVTAPISKALVADHVDRSFRGHTDYLAAKTGLTEYGRDYLMTFLTPDLKVALLTVHQPLRDAIEGLTVEGTLAALRCLDRGCERGPTLGRRVAVAGLNPHAGEGGLLGTEEERLLAPAIAAARAEGIDVIGPLSADTLFSRARQGLVDWVLALYHDQGLIAVKTAAFGTATQWTMGLPVLRTSVDHGTAYDAAAKGEADPSSLEAVLDTTLAMVRRKQAAATGA